MPMLYLISKHCTGLEYVEIVSQIASKSAGMATRINVDSYIHTTEMAIREFTNCDNCKVIFSSCNICRRGISASVSGSYK